MRVPPCLLTMYNLKRERLLKILRKLSWRTEFIFDGLRYYPRSIIDKDFWKILFRSSDFYVTLPFSPQSRLKPLVERLLAYFFSAEGFFEFPINYYGKKFSLRIFSNDDMHVSVAAQFIDLIFPYLSLEAKVTVSSEVESILTHAFAGMSWELNHSLFHAIYLFPKIRGVFWIYEGRYDNEKSAVREGDVVFDVGACMGIFACLAGLAAGEKGKVWAFEPLKKYAEIARKNIALNGLHNVLVVEKALGDKHSMVHMKGISVVGEGGDILMTTLDEFIQENGIERLDFLKMDVEGFERRVLQGGMNALKKYKPRMGICVYHQPDDPKVLRELIFFINPEYHVELNETGKKFIVF